MSKLCIGKIVKAQGLKGDVKIYPYTDLSMFEDLKSIYVGEETDKSNIEHMRFYNNMVYIKLENSNDRNQAEALCGNEIYIDKEEANVKSGEYLVDDLLGVKVLLDNGQDMGEIIDIANFGAADIITVSGKYGKWQVPFVEDIVQTIDLENNIIIFFKKRFDEVKI